jgi:polyferredoxin
MGGANLVARSVMLVAPLGLALASAWQDFAARLEHPGKAGRFIIAVAYIAGGLFCLAAHLLLYTASLGGAFFAWLVSLGVYAALVYWKQIRSSRFWPRTRLAKGAYLRLWA